MADDLQRVQTEYIIAVLHINFSVLIDHKLPAVIAFYNVAGFASVFTVRVAKLFAPVIILERPPVTVIFFSVH